MANTEARRDPALRAGRAVGIAAGVALSVLLQACSSAPAAQLSREESKVMNTGEPRYIGEMTPFWRNRPVLGRWLSGGLGLTEVPDYLLRTSFPYRKRPHPREVLFADSFTVVRLLGGWDKTKPGGELDGDPRADLAYRGEDGEVRYRWGLLAPRLDPYIEAGYRSFTIVLDNTPWCFPAATSSGTFGQASPPASMEEWGTFVEALCEQLVALYGFDLVNTWRFRQGTECSGTERFDGPQDEYFRQYDYSAAAAKKVVPGADFGPFNQAAGKENPPGNNVDYYALADHCVAGENAVSGAIGTPLDFLSVSSYSIPLRTSEGRVIAADPEEKARQNIRFWDSVETRHPSLSIASREVHEFGILSNEYGLRTDEPGARGAAYRFHTIFSMREGGLDALWHWDCTEELRVGRRRRLLKSNGWLYSILEHTVGGQTYVLETPERTAEGTQYRAIAVFGLDNCYIMISAYNVDRTVSSSENVSLVVPRTHLEYRKSSSVGVVEINRTNSVYYQIREDLEREDLLAEGFREAPGCLSTVRP